MAATSRMLGESHGLELYRYILSRFKVVGPENGQRLLDEVLNPKGCRTPQELRDSLLEMMQNTKELTSYGSTFSISEPQLLMSLEKALAGAPYLP